jgi:hypothetical protein
MNELELKELWKLNNEKLEKSVAAVRINSNEITRLKVYHPDRQPLGWNGDNIAWSCLPVFLFRDQ